MLLDRSESLNISFIFDVRDLLQDIHTWSEKSHGAFRVKFISIVSTIFTEFTNFANPAQGLNNLVMYRAIHVAKGDMYLYKMYVMLM